MKKVSKTSQLSDGILLFCGKTQEDTLREIKEFSEKYGVEINNYYITSYDPRLILAGYTLKEVTDDGN